MADGQKTCVFCGQSCAGQPRIKDSRGLYAHRACAEARQQAEAETAAHVDNGLDDGLAGMDDLLGDLDLEEAEASGPAVSCAGCGQRMAEGTVVCLGCGYNAQTGKMMSTRSKDGQAGVGGAALGIGAKAGGLAAAPLFPIIGAVIGGAVGALIWAGIAYQFNVEIGWIAIGVGFLCGLGAAIGARGEGGAITGAMAAVVAMGSISAGKYAATYWAVQDVFSSDFFSEITIEDVDDQWALSTMVDELCEEKLNDGVEIGWEDPMLFLEGAYWPDDFPQEVQDAIHDKWHSMSMGDRLAFRKGIAQESGDGVSARDVDQHWALSSMAYMYCESLIENEETIQWADPDQLAISVAFWPENYPAAIQEETYSRWEEMGEEGRFAYRSDLLDKTNEARANSGNYTQEIVKDGFVQSFMHPFDLLFMFLAVGAAYSVASNES